MSTRRSQIIRWLIIVGGVTSLAACHTTTVAEALHPEGAVIPAIQEKVDIHAEPQLTRKERRVVADAAARVVDHLSWARDALDFGKTKVAQRNLDQAKRLIHILRSALPTTRIRDRIQSARSKLSYQDTEVISQDLVPVAEELSVVEELVPATRERAHLKSAREHLARHERKAAEADLKAIDESEGFAELELDLAGTQRNIQRALADLRHGDVAAARKAMKASEALFSLKVQPTGSKGARKVEITLGVVDPEPAAAPSKSASCRDHGHHASRESSAHHHTKHHG